jgi:hypothetical protein
MGAALAVKMLRDLERAAVARQERCFVNPAERRPKGAAQWNVVLEYLDTIGELTDNREAVEGFASILSDYVASAAAGCVPDADTYREASRAAR